MNGLISLEAAFTTGGLILKVDGAIAQEVTRVLISTQTLNPPETPPHRFAKLYSILAVNSIYLQDF